MTFISRKHGLRLALASATLIGFGASASATAATATGDAQVQIIQAISISPGDTLDFGGVAPGAADGTVTIDPTTGDQTCSAELSCAVGNAAAGSFTVTGQDGYTYEVTLPADGTVTLTDAIGDGGNDMSVDTFTSSNDDGTSQLVGGTDTLTVGATLTVPTGQTASVYDGTYDVTVEYN